MGGFFYESANLYSMNRTLLITTGALLLIAIVGILFSLFLDDVLVLRTEQVAKMIATCTLLAYGTFMNRRYFSLVYVAATGIAVGAAFMVLDYEGGREILNVSLIAMPALYFVHFVTKPQKGLLDLLKLTTVLLHFTLVLLVLNHILDFHNLIHNQTWVRLLPEGSFWLAFAYFTALKVEEKIG